MVDSRQKGSRAELAARDILRKYTGLGWERVPSSGALSASHKLKGDLYVPEMSNRFCVEVKHYADDQLSTKLLTDKKPQFLKWWDQALEQAKKVDRQPLLIFKHDRSKWFVAFNDIRLVNNCTNHIRYFKNTYDTIYITKLEEWLETEKITWEKNF